MQALDGSIKIYTQDGKAIIKLSGALNGALAENLRAIVPKITPPVILDFQQTPYITADGLQVLLEFYTLHQVAPTLVGANALTQRLIKLTGMDRYLKFDHKPLDSQVS